MKNKYFGTDGIRGTVNQGNITGEKFFKFGLASGTYFKNQKKSKQIAVIAKDTRLSGYTLEPALVSGLVSGGMHVFTLGPLPTNGLAMLTKIMKANMGIMITASHNPYYDNGLKLFGPDGMKLSDKIEKKIEKLIDSKNAKQLTNPKLLGRVKRLENGNARYIKILKKNFPNKFNLKGTKIDLKNVDVGTKALPTLFLFGTQYTFRERNKFIKDLLQSQYYLRDLFISIDLEEFYTKKVFTPASFQRPRK